MQETNEEELNEEVREDDEEEGAVGGIIESQHHEVLTNHGVMLHSHPANQIGRRSKVLSVLTVLMLIFLFVFYIGS